ncbi:iron-sulfur cluster assembly scaffold protein [Maridesulfovibrio ferrireducens]|uniref:iron-sulfur cluster assembly scaffold protein n=1 Tax=Maridesulfovibrio ferrireducens TaxID=246191 RepID=UPI001A315047|nr:iron-sulfur cluster assembly scaffold protein [Maridesulfovibrio ferrireducens]MBI9112555.1 iron-sulfur cluster assembly scaffold protein [Maridesulfovibrio ferrireducens]
MTDPFNNLLSTIQQSCDDAAVDMFGKETTSRWKNPSFAAIMENPDSVGDMKGTCGDCIKIFLKFDDNKICKASFYTDGCGASIVSADAACELSCGKTIDEASEIDGEDIVQLLGKIPEDKKHCAHLASSALQEALGSWLKKKV